MSSAQPLKKVSSEHFLNMFEFSDSKTVGDVN